MLYFAKCRLSQILSEFDQELGENGANGMVAIRVDPQNTSIFKTDGLHIYMTLRISNRVQMFQ